MTKRNILIGGRLFFGALDLISLLILLVIFIQHGFDVVNFFGYFTNLSNIFASVVLLIGGIFLLQGRKPTERQEVIRGASVVAMVIVGIVYFLLLRNEDLGALPPWINFVVHGLMPIVVLVDWLFAPPLITLNWRQTASWLIYPLIYLVYTLIRGAAVGFYPYPFLNPAKVGGAGAVALYCLAIFVMFLLFGWILTTLANRLPRQVA